MPGWVQDYFNNQFQEPPPLAYAEPTPIPPAATWGGPFVDVPGHQVPFSMPSQFTWDYSANPYAGLSGITDNPFEGGSDFASQGIPGSLNLADPSGFAWDYSSNWNPGSAGQTSVPGNDLVNSAMAGNSFSAVPSGSYPQFDFSAGIPGSINQPGSDISGFGGEMGLGQDFNTAAGGQYAWTGAGVGAPTAPFSYDQWANEAGMYPGGETWPTGSSESAETGTGGIAQPGYDVTNFGGNLSLGNNVESPDIWTNQGGLAQPPPTLDQEFSGYMPPAAPMPQVSTDYGSFSGSSVTPDNPSWEQEFAQNGGFEYGVPMPQVQQGSTGGQPTQSLQPGETSLGGLGSANAGQIGTPAPYTGAGITPWGSIGGGAFSLGSGLDAGSFGSGFDFGTGVNADSPGTSGSSGGPQAAPSGAGTGSNQGGTGGSAAYGSVNAPDIQSSTWAPPADAVQINASNFAQYSQYLPWWTGSAESHASSLPNGGGINVWIDPTTHAVSYPITPLPMNSQRYYL